MKRIITLVLVTLLALSFVGFAEEEKPLDGLSILVSTYFLEDDFCVEMNNTIVDRCYELGAKEVALQNANSDSEVQTRQIESYLEKGVDYMFVDPMTLDALVPVLEKAADKGVMTVLFDGGANTRKGIITHVSMNDQLMGNTLGEYLENYIRDEMGGKATIMYLYWMEIERHSNRIAGVKEILDAAEGLELTTFDLDSKGSRETAANVTANYAGPYDLIVCSEMNTAWGAVSTLEAQNAKDIKVYAIGDWSKEGFEAIRDGHKYYSTFCTVSPYGIANDSVDALVEYIKNGTTSDVTYVKTPMVSKENMTEFWDFDKF